MKGILAFVTLRVVVVSAASTSFLSLSKDALLSVYEVLGYTTQLCNHMGYTVFI